MCFQPESMKGQNTEMIREKLIAREKEIHRLQNCVREQLPQLIILYGRRRVGKTYLINSFFEKRFDFKITGVYQEKKETQLRYFAEELSGQTKKTITPPKDWIAAFRLLRDYLSSLPKDEKHVVFFDELPWLDTMHSGFLPAFEHFWNDFGCTLNNLVFVACGSATSWMTKKIASNKGGLFNRQTCSIYLQPFTLRETEMYLRARGIEWSRYDIAECYMILGGIPYYLSLLEPDKSLAENIDNLFFRKRAELWNEFDHLYKTLFTNSEPYIRIAEALSKKRSGLTRNDIIHETNMLNNGVLTEMLNNLESSGFLRVSNSFGKQKKETRYQLCDYYSLFYFRYLKDFHGRDEHYWSHIAGSPSKNTWTGLTFEQVCLDHIQQIKKKIGISGVLSEEFAWIAKGNDESRGAQIDLVIDRRDHVIDLCEIKYSEREFTIDKAYDRILRNKREIFRENTGTKKTVQLVLISTYGIKLNQYSSLISNQVLLDDLFAET